MSTERRGSGVAGIWRFEVNVASITGFLSASACALGLQNALILEVAPKKNQNGRLDLVSGSSRRPRTGGDVKVNDNVDRALFGKKSRAVD